MSVHKFQKIQFIPTSLNETWDFFSHPKNLAVMTPDYLNLKFTNELYGDEKATVIPHMWLPKWSGETTDPSARTLAIY